MGPGRNCGVDGLMRQSEHQVHAWGPGPGPGSQRYEVPQWLGLLGREELPDQEEEDRLELEPRGGPGQNQPLERSQAGLQRRYTTFSDVPLVQDRPERRDSRLPQRRSQLAFASGKLADDELEEETPLSLYDAVTSLAEANLSLMDLGDLCAKLRRAFSDVEGGGVETGNAVVITKDYLQRVAGRAETEDKVQSLLKFVSEVGGDEPNTSDGRDPDVVEHELLGARVQAILEIIAKLDWEHLVFEFGQWLRRTKENSKGVSDLQDLYWEQYNEVHRMISASKLAMEDTLSLHMLVASEELRKFLEKLLDGVRSNDWGAKMDKKTLAGFEAQLDRLREIRKSTEELLASNANLATEARKHEEHLRQMREAVENHEESDSRPASRGSQRAASLTRPFFTLGGEDGSLASLHSEEPDKPADNLQKNEGAEEHQAAEEGGAEDEDDENAAVHFGEGIEAGTGGRPEEEDDGRAQLKAGAESTKKTKAKKVKMKDSNEASKDEGALQEKSEGEPSSQDQKKKKGEGSHQQSNKSSNLQRAQQRTAKFAVALARSAVRRGDELMDKLEEAEREVSSATGKLVLSAREEDERTCGVERRARLLQRLREKELLETRLAHLHDRLNSLTYRLDEDDRRMPSEPPSKRKGRPQQLMAGRSTIVRPLATMAATTAQRGTEATKVAEPVAKEPERAQWSLEEQKEVDRQRLGLQERLRTQAQKLLDLQARCRQLVEDSSNEFGTEVWTLTEAPFEVRFRRNPRKLLLPVVREMVDAEVKKAAETSADCSMALADSIQAAAQAQDLMDSFMEIEAAFAEEAQQRKACEEDGKQLDANEWDPRTSQALDALIHKFANMRALPEVPPGANKPRKSKKRSLNLSAVKALAELAGSHLQPGTPASISATPRTSRTSLLPESMATFESVTPRSMAIPAMDVVTDSSDDDEPEQPRVISHALVSPPLRLALWKAKTKAKAQQQALSQRASLTAQMTAQKAERSECVSKLEELWQLKQTLLSKRAALLEVEEHIEALALQESAARVGSHGSRRRSSPPSSRRSSKSQRQPSGGRRASSPSRSRGNSKSRRQRTPSSPSCRRTDSVRTTADGPTRAASERATLSASNPLELLKKLHSLCHNEDLAADPGLAPLLGTLEEEQQQTDENQSGQQCTSRRLSRKAQRSSQGRAFPTTPSRFQESPPPSPLRHCRSSATGLSKDSPKTRRDAVVPSCEEEKALARQQKLDELRQQFGIRQLTDNVAHETKANRQLELRIIRKRQDLDQMIKRLAKMTGREKLLPGAASSVAQQSSPFAVKVNQFKSFVTSYDKALAFWRGRVARWFGEVRQTHGDEVATLLDSEGRPESIMDWEPLLRALLANLGVDWQRQGERDDAKKRFFRAMAALAETKPDSKEGRRLFREALRHLADLRDLGQVDPAEIRRLALSALADAEQRQRRRHSKGSSVRQGADDDNAGDGDALTRAALHKRSSRLEHRLTMFLNDLGSGVPKHERELHKWFKSVVLFSGSLPPWSGPTPLHDDGSELLSADSDSEEAGKRESRRIEMRLLMRGGFIRKPPPVKGEEIFDEAIRRIERQHRLLRRRKERLADRRLLEGVDLRRTSRLTMLHAFQDQMGDIDAQLLAGGGFAGGGEKAGSWRGTRATTKRSSTIPAALGAGDDADDASAKQQQEQQGPSLHRDGDLEAPGPSPDHGRRAIAAVRAKMRSKSWHGGMSREGPGGLAAASCSSDADAAELLRGMRAQLITMYGGIAKGYDWVLDTAAPVGGAPGVMSRKLFERLCRILCIGSEDAETMFAFLLNKRLEIPLLELQQEGVAAVGRADFSRTFWWLQPVSDLTSLRRRLQTGFEDLRNAFSVGTGGSRAMSWPQFRALAARVMVDQSSAHALFKKMARHNRYSSATPGGPMVSRRAFLLTLRHAEGISAARRLRWRLREAQTTLLENLCVEGASTSANCPVVSPPARGKSELRAAIDHCLTLVDPKYRSKPLGRRDMQIAFRRLRLPQGDVAALFRAASGGGRRQSICAHDVAMFAIRGFKLGSKRALVPSESAQALRANEQQSPDFGSFVEADASADEEGANCCLSPSFSVGDSSLAAEDNSVHESGRQIAEAAGLALISGVIRTLRIGIAGAGGAPAAPDGRLPLPRPLGGPSLALPLSPPEDLRVLFLSRQAVLGRHGPPPTPRRLRNTRTPRTRPLQQPGTAPDGGLERAPSPPLQPASAGGTGPSTPRDSRVLDQPQVSFMSETSFTSNSLNRSREILQESKLAEAGDLPYPSGPGGLGEPRLLPRLTEDASSGSSSTSFVPLPVAVGGGQSEAAERDMLDAERHERTLALFAGSMPELEFAIRKAREFRARSLGRFRSPRAAFAKLAAGGSEIPWAELGERIETVLSLRSPHALQVAELLRTIIAEQAFDLNGLLAAFRFAEPVPSLLDLHKRLVQRHGSLEGGLRALGFGPGVTMELERFQHAALREGISSADGRRLFLAADAARRRGPHGLVDRDDLLFALRNSPVLSWLEWSSVPLSSLGGGPNGCRHREALVDAEQLQDVLATASLPLELAGPMFAFLSERTAGPTLEALVELARVAAGGWQQEGRGSIAGATAVGQRARGAHGYGGSGSSGSSGSAQGRCQEALVARAKLRELLRSRSAVYQGTFRTTIGKNGGDSVSLEGWMEAREEFGLPEEAWALVFGHSTGWKHPRWNSCNHGPPPQLTAEAFAAAMEEAAPCRTLGLLRSRLACRCGSLQNAWRLVSGRDGAEEVRLPQWRLALQQLGIHAGDAGALWALARAVPHADKGSGQEQLLTRAGFLAALRGADAMARLFYLLSRAAGSLAGPTVPVPRAFEGCERSHCPLAAGEFEECLAGLLAVGSEDAHLFFQLLDVHHEGAVSVDTLLDLLTTLQGSCLPGASQLLEAGVGQVSTTSPTLTEETQTAEGPPLLKNLPVSLQLVQADRRRASQTPQTHKETQTPEGARLQATPSPLSVSRLQTPRSLAPSHNFSSTPLRRLGSDSVSPDHLDLQDYLRRSLSPGKSRTAASLSLALASTALPEDSDDSDIDAQGGQRCSSTVPLPQRPWTSMSGVGGAKKPPARTCPRGTLRSMLQRPTIERPASSAPRPPTESVEGDDCFVGMEGSLSAREPPVAAASAWALFRMHDATPRAQFASKDMPGRLPQLEQSRRQTPTPTGEPIRGALGRVGAASTSTKWSAGASATSASRQLPVATDERHGRFAQRRQGAQTAMGVARAEGKANKRRLMRDATRA